MNKINVVGLGYIGLPTALMLAAYDIDVIGTDYNEKLVQTLNDGHITFSEDGLEELFQKALKKGIIFSTEYACTDKYIVAVPTPYNKKNKKIDAHYIIGAIDAILSVCKKGATIVIESTISPGTIDKVVRPFVEAKQFVVGKDIHLVHAPERIIPGNMIFELKYNSRTIGADDMDKGEEIKEIYSFFCQGEIVVTDIRTAEMTKVVENTYRDINIAFANELAKICQSDGMNVYEIIKIANKHPRVNILAPGPGVGGHCISVDPWFLVGDYPGLANIIFAARKINDSMPEYVLSRIAEIMQENKITNLSRVGFYGLTYKEDVDDVRESPTLQILASMKSHLSNGFVQVYDPYIEENIVSNQKHEFTEFIDNIDLIVILVAHSEIRQRMKELKGKVIFDTRKICTLPGTYYL